MSRSAILTRHPALAYSRAMRRAMTDFPTPPFWEMTAISSDIPNLVEERKNAVKANCSHECKQQIDTRNDIRAFSRVSFRLTLLAYPCLPTLSSFLQEPRHDCRDLSLPSLRRESGAVTPI